VTGPTGVLGRATIPLLIAAGYQVKALSRSTANDSAIREQGAEPVRSSLFDPGSLEAALAGVDAVLHLATRIPQGADVRRPDAWHDNDRVRAEGMRTIVDAALKAGTRTVVYPSFAYVYPDRGDEWIDVANTPPDPVTIMESTLAAEREVARFAATEDDFPWRGVSLRLGALYGPDLPSTQTQLQMAERGISPFGAGKQAFTPILWIDDAASALLAAVERAPSGTYDVVDDEPMRHAELAQLMAPVVRRKSLWTLPTWLVRMAAGEPGGALSRSMRISNRRFREATGWTPSVANGREGIARIADSYHPMPQVGVPAALRLGLALMFIFALLAGLQQQLAPRSFYDSFPGFGMQWVSIDGPYNEHLLRDLGGANLALAMVIGFALLRPSVGLVRAVAAALLIAQVPHFIYHAFHLDLLPTLRDQVLQTASLAAIVLLPLLVFIAARGIREPAQSVSGVANDAPQNVVPTTNRLIAGTAPPATVTFAQAPSVPRGSALQSLQR
jgi:nucleoside-diphosphate-sugar epimerase